MYFHAMCMYVYVTCTLILFHVSYHMYMYFHATYVYVTCTEYWETVERGNFRRHVKTTEKTSLEYSTGVSLFDEPCSVFCRENFH